nr:CPBP family intramembrane glutamic endopeptidase [Ornithinimicrobium pratense]
MARAAHQAFAGSPPEAPALWFIIPALVAMAIVGGGQEEIGWRGVLQPALTWHLGRWAGAVLAGVVWFCWHLPLWWTPGAVQQHIPMAAFAAFCIGFSLLVQRGFEVTGGSVLLAVWLHALNNASAVWLVFYSSASNQPPIGSWVLGTAYLAVGIVVMMARYGGESTNSGASAETTRDCRSVD